MTADGLWFRTDCDLHDAITTALDVEVEGQYHRLEQASSATYHGRWGSHHIEEALYREVGVHNGPTIKPIELRVGIIEHMTPDMARIVGALSAEHSSRSVERTLRTTGLAAPSRAFLAKRTTATATEIADGIETFEQTARAAEPVPVDVGSVSCGLDRMAVRMSELAAPETPRQTSRSEPYERTRPPAKDHCYRMAWVGSTSIYDKQGNELQTWRYAADANTDPAIIARRVATDVARIATARADVPIHCVQDGAPELRALPEALTRQLPAGRIPVVLVDFEHLMSYLDDIVDACHPAGDVHDWKGWYRSLLLRDDGAIDQIWRKLRGIGLTLVGRGTAARNAVAAALSYIRRRKAKMRYASHYAANLPIGSGATESTCWQMQQRVKLHSRDRRGTRSGQHTAPSDVANGTKKSHPGMPRGHPLRGMHARSRHSEAVRGWRATHHRMQP
ncbi:MAG: hypothetical protein H0T79_02260 [Deltaproteobacteria bacterium]|nr:hypothetical protein [Deltaproteobacteria bacterium]